MLLQELVDTSDHVAEIGSRRKKLSLMADLLARVPEAEIEIAVAFLSGHPRQGRIGIGPANLQALEPQGAPKQGRLSLAETDAALGEIARIRGSGSAARRRNRLERLLERATPAEQNFLKRLLVGELRQGAQARLLLEAVAQAAGVDPEALRRAVMVAGRLGPVASAVLTQGKQGIVRFVMRPFHPLQPMLAQPAEDMDDALAQLGRARLEYKLDGARVQVHRLGSEVRVYTRRLRDVTSAVPELVEVARGLAAESAIIDAEALAMKKNGKPHSFQTTMRRLGRREDVATLRRQLPLSVYFFDLLYVDGEPLLDAAARDRMARLQTVTPGAQLIPQLETDDAEQAHEFLRQARAAGHEGVMAKNPASAYSSGSRGAAWLKVKPVHTLDLVVLAAEWGHGRRRGWLSNLHLGARGEDGFVMLGKTFKGLTDDMLRWQTQTLLGLETRREGHVVFVRPELVVEIAFNDVQTSPHYPGGLALRFARVKGYRRDKTPAEADTLDRVRAIHEQQTG